MNWYIGIRKGDLMFTDIHFLHYLETNVVHIASQCKPQTGIPVELFILFGSVRHSIYQPQRQQEEKSEN